jgi:hypothetical protein
LKKEEMSGKSTPGVHIQIRFFMPFLEVRYSTKLSRVGILEELLKYNLSCLVITNGTLPKDDLSLIVDSLESTSAANSCLVITTNLSPMMKNSATDLDLDFFRLRIKVTFCTIW